MAIHVFPGHYYEKVRVPPEAPPIDLVGLGKSPEEVLLAWNDADATRARGYFTSISDS